MLLRTRIYFSFTLFIITMEKIKEINHPFKKEVETRYFEREDEEEFKKYYNKIWWEEWDAYLYKYMGYSCLIYRVRGHLNWYVGIPKDHPLHWLDYCYYEAFVDDFQAKTLEDKKKVLINNLKVHWGLTFAGTTRFLRAEEYDFNYLFWFDTAHSWDAHIEEHYFASWVYRNMHYVIEELNYLVRQIVKGLEDLK